MQNKLGPSEFAASEIQTSMKDEIAIDTIKSSNKISVLAQEENYHLVASAKTLSPKQATPLPLETFH